MREVVRSLTEALEAGRELILCQVVETRGSTPQKAGALMLVDSSGGQVGTLGGGCVENEVKQKAIRQLGTTGASLHSFVLDHDQAWADGLICGGKMVILTECVRGPEPLAYFRIFSRLLEAGEGLTEAIVVNPERLEGDVPVGRRFLFDAEGTHRASWPDGAVPEPVASRIRPLNERPKPEVNAGLTLLPVLPRVRLVIVGAGHVGQAVAALASQVDFDVWVIDDRAQYANPERFPGAQRLLVGPIEEVADRYRAGTLAEATGRDHGFSPALITEIPQGGSA